jgi:O-antigen ligase/polysaccharide polymerase Wzy-like membrane protein
MTKFLSSFRWLLVGYALFGRSVAYLGIPPLFVGEIFLGWGLVRSPILRALPRLFTSPAFLLLFFFMLYCGILTMMGFSHFAIVDVLRDGVVWGYGSFAFIIAAYCLNNPAVIAESLKSYSYFAGLYLFLGPSMALVGPIFSNRLPTIPGTTIAILAQKPGDIEVHLAGIMAFIYLGLRRFNIFQLALLLIGILILGSFNRGGFLAFFCAVCALVILKPRLQFIAAMLGAIIVAVSIFTFVDINIDFFGRSISTAQIGRNVLSIVGLSSSSSIDLSDTRQWRLDWWKQIIDYTFHGDYFWTGKGFGINLADSDGIVDTLAEQGEPLRSPHNSHMTFLARGGVPLFFFWIVLQLSWAFGMVRTVFRARARGDAFWERASIFVLTYWVAMIVNMSFDVYLEGPMGGIWFWTIWGYGLAIMWLHRYRPQSLAQAEPSAAGAPSPALAPQAAE